MTLVLRIVPKIFLFLLAIYIIPIKLLSQPAVVNETVRSNQYILTYRFPIIDRIKFNGSRDSSFLARNLFIALPKDVKPAVKIVVTDKENINDDGTFNSYRLQPQYKIKGYLWIGNQYCLHILVSPIQFDNSSDKIFEIKEFQVELTHPVFNNIQQQKIESNASGLVDNSKYSNQWIVNNHTAEVSTNDSWIDYTKEYLKLGVVRDGIYKLRKSDLEASGVNTSSLNPKSLKLFLRGKEIPIYVQGENDNTFNDSDYVEFVGRRNYGDIRYRDIASVDKPYFEFMNIYSDTTIYWLTWNGSNGIRVDTILSISGSSFDTTKYYDELIHSEKNVYYDYSFTGNEVRNNNPEILENETWNEGNLNVGSVGIQFSVSNLFPNKPARAYVKLQNYSSSVDQNAHNLALSINTRYPAYDSGFINKYQVKVLKADFQSTRLVNGTNTVTIHSFATLNTVNTVIRDWYELEYPRYLKTNTDSLVFTYRNVPSKYLSRIAIAGFSSASLSLYKFSSTDSSIQKITNYSKSNDTLYFLDSINLGNYYFVLSNAKIGAPLIFYKKQFINLRSTQNQAEYIAITHPYFISAASSYVSFITSTYNITTKVIDINDIYDEFNYGFFSPEPIKEFLKSTQAFWQLPKPKHVFLIGKGTYDFYGNKTRYFGVPKTINFVPTYGNPVSDSWFVQWDSTGSLIPQMNIGRLPVKNIDEFQHYFSKHQKYVSKGYDDWNKRYLFFAGGNITDPNQIAQTKAVNDFIINNYVNKVPTGGNFSNFYKTANPVTNFGPYTPEYVENAIDQGSLFISYIGHSGTQTWDNSITDISQLSNIRDRSPMISDFGCSTGKFAEPDVNSFSELAVSNIQGQAISYIGNSSLGFEPTAYSFPQIFYRTLLVDTSASLGDVHRLAKIKYLKQFGTNGTYGLMIKTNSLIGDPIVKLPIPTKPNFSFTNSIVKIEPDRPTDQHDSILVNVKYYNLGKVIGDSIDFSIRAELQGKNIFSKIFKRKVPLYEDSLLFGISLNGTAGEYTITIISDSLNIYDEIYENDNIITYQTIVSSTNIKNAVLSPSQNQTTRKLHFLNPSIKPLNSNFIVDVSLNSNFSPSTLYQVQYDTFATSFILDSSFFGKRIWLRAKSDVSSSAGLSNSYIVGSKENILINDAEAFSHLNTVKIKYSQSSMALDTTNTILSAISGGFNDGNTAVISKNGQNFVPENTVRGFHVCIFDALTYDFKWYFRYDVQAGITISTNFKSLLDTLSNNYFVVIAISNDVAANGTNLPASLKNAIKQYGSKFIDSVKVADSWTLIGRKGALSGSVPEKYSKRFATGSPIKIDTTIITPNNTGTFSTQSFGPVSSWKSIETEYSTSNSSSINLGVIGIKSDLTADTLQQHIPISSVINVSSVNAKQYPYIKVFGTMNAGIGNISPSLSSLAVNYTMLPELGTNYQVFKGYHLQNNIPAQEITSTDTILQGEKIQLTYRIYNVGGTTANNIPIKLHSTWDNNYVEPIAVQTIDSIAPESYKEINTEYNTSLGSGKRTIQLSIDPDTTIKEIYKDNNFYSFPIVIKKSSGNPLLPNLYIAQNAVTSIPVQLTDEIDTARFSIVYGNSGSIVNDSISIQIKHLYLGNILATKIIRRKYPIANDTVSIAIPIMNNSGEHQLTIDLDFNGLIVESSESDNLTNYYFTVATSDFKILHPAPHSISSVTQAVFLNPTVVSGSGSSVNFELDTLPGFSSAQQFSQPFQKFTSIFPLPGLRKSKRYYWRIKISNSSHDWTTGTFYSGDSLSTVFGQVDSAAWKQNTFLRTGYSQDSGARIIDTKISIKAMSAGFNDGNTGFVEVNNNNVIIQNFGSGHNIAVLDSVTFAVYSQRRFDITANPDESDSLMQFITSVPNGLFVIDVVINDGANNLKQSARDALKTIGSKFIDQLSFRDSWSIIGRKGAIVGSVPEMFKQANTGNALAETTVTRIEKSGMIVTPILGPFTSLSSLVLNQTIPSGSQLKVQFVGISNSNSIDTLVTSINQNSISLSSVDTWKYRFGKLVFLFTVPSTLRNRRSIAALNSPVIANWKLTAIPSTELAVSNQTTSISNDQVMEGETINFTGTVFNISTVAAESVTVQLKSTTLGIDQILHKQRFINVPFNDSVSFSYSYNTRGRKGSHAFTFEIDPDDSVAEQTKSNNSVTIPYTVLADSLRPSLQITIDGGQVVNGDFVGNHPEIRIRYTDNNPSSILSSDTSNFKIKLNNVQVPFIKGTAELLSSNSVGKAEIRWTPELIAGENIIQISAKDIAENYSDTILIYVNVANEFRIMDIFNLPNPFNTFTHFTFNLAGPTSPDEIIIKIYTVAGRLIQEISTLGNIGFNKIPWDGRDKDGDQIGNGVYLYKVIVKQGGKQIEGLSKLVKMR